MRSSVSVCARTPASSSFDSDSASDERQDRARLLRPRRDLGAERGGEPRPCRRASRRGCPAP